MIKIRGSVLLTILVATGILVTLLGVVFSFSGLTQTQAKRETWQALAVDLGNAGLNDGLAKYRANTAYTGETYSLNTGTIKTSFQTQTALLPQLIADVYVPDENTPNHICQRFQITVNGNNTPATVYPQSYKELPCPNLSGSPSPSAAPSQNQPPTLSFTKPDGNDSINAGTPYAVTYSLNDPDSVVTGQFYYTPSQDQLPGTPIAGACSAAPEGTNLSCNWDTTGLSTGWYYVYGIADDGTTTVGPIFAPGPVWINGPTSPSPTPQPGGGRISGLTTVNGVPTAGISVCAHDNNYNYGYCGASDGNGNYVLGPFPSNCYWMTATWQGQELWGSVCIFNGDTTQNWNFYGPQSVTPTTGPAPTFNLSL